MKLHVAPTNARNLAIFCFDTPFSKINLIMQLQAAAFIMFSTLARSTAFVARPLARGTTARTFVTPTLSVAAESGQAEVILVGCGAPNRGMGWYHAVQMLEKK